MRPLRSPCPTPCCACWSSSLTNCRGVSGAGDDPTVQETTILRIRPPPAPLLRRRGRQCRVNRRRVARRLRNRHYSTFSATALTTFRAPTLATGARDLHRYASRKRLQQLHRSATVTAGKRRSRTSPAALSLRLLTLRRRDPAVTGNARASAAIIPNGNGSLWFVPDNQVRIIDVATRQVCHALRARHG